MRELVINKCFGGFSLSDEACDKLSTLKRKPVGPYDACEWPRDDADLVKVVKDLGTKANGMCAKLKIVKIPDDVKWTIEDYDGLEHVAEEHRMWG
jgi:hypothetical protein